MGPVSIPAMSARKWSELPLTAIRQHNVYETCAAESLLGLLRRYPVVSEARILVVCHHFYRQRAVPLANPVVGS